MLQWGTRPALWGARRAAHPLPPCPGKPCAGHSSPCRPLATSCLAPLATCSSSWMLRRSRRRQRAAQRCRTSCPTACPPCPAGRHCSEGQVACHPFSVIIPIPGGPSTLLGQCLGGGCCSAQHSLSLANRSLQYLLFCKYIYLSKAPVPSAVARLFSAALRRFGAGSATCPTWHTGAVVQESARRGPVASAPKGAVTFVLLSVTPCPTWQAVELAFAKP